MADKTEQKKNGLFAGRRVALFALAALLLLLMVTVIVLRPHFKKIEAPKPVKTESNVREPLDTGLRKPADTGTLKPPDTGMNMPAGIGTNKPFGKGIHKPPDTGTHKLPDTGKQKPAVHTGANETVVTVVTAHTDTAAAANKDTAKPESEAAFLEKGKEPECAQDTVPLWVYSEPAGGLHYGTTLVWFRSNKKCSVSWYLTPDSTFRTWNGDSISITKNATLVFMAVDKCGYVMPERREMYAIEQSTAAGVCPKDMDPVKIAGMQFCIDRYEWPNRKGALPLAYISLYQATDSCFKDGKRLCTSEEWSLACSGPYSWRFPYGQDFEPRACVTSDTIVRPSGSKPECRAYFGSFDMSGNLLEWTSTPAKENHNYNNVVGGFWESGPRSGCFDVRYSYFPQNRHNPVGFRCCKDVK